MINLVFEQEFSTDCRSDFGKYFCKIKIWYISWSGRRDSNSRPALCMPYEVPKIEKVPCKYIAN